MKKRLMFLIALVIVSLVTFSNATFAWFSKQYNPQVSNLKFNVLTQENMMISKTGQPGTFKDEIPFNELVGQSVTLKPVDGKITENSIEMYSEGELITDQTLTYIKFPLYFSGSNDMDVYLKGSLGGTVIDIIKTQNNNFTEEEISKMVDSIRIGFLAYSTREIPTGSGTTEVTYTPLYTNVYSVNEKTDESYSKDGNPGLKPYETFTSLGHTEGALNDVVLLNVQANKVSKLDVYIWLENQDKSCEQSIFNTQLRVNLRFLAVNVEEDDDE